MSYYEDTYFGIQPSLNNKKENKAKLQLLKLFDVELNAYVEVPEQFNINFKWLNGNSYDSEYDPLLITAVINKIFGPTFTYDMAVCEDEETKEYLRREDLYHPDGTVNHYLYETGPDIETVTENDTVKFNLNKVTGTNKEIKRLKEQAKKKNYLELMEFLKKIK